MKRLAMFVVVMIALAVSTVSAQWFRVDMGTIDAQDISFRDTSEGWVAGAWDNLVKKSTDGGRNWQQVGLPVTWYQYWGVLAKENNVWVVGSNQGTPGAGIVLYSSDRGASWQVIDHPATNSWWYDVAQFGQNIIVVGTSPTQPGLGDGLLMRSSDNGVSWQLTEFPQCGTLKSIAVVNDSVAWIVGAHGAILKTTNGGFSWVDRSIDTTVDYTQVTFSKDGQVGYLNGWREFTNVPLRTTDGGDTWVPWNPKPGYYVGASAAVGNDTVYVGMYGPDPDNEILMSTDRGVTFQSSSPMFGSWSSFLASWVIDARHIWFIDPLNVYYYDYQPENGNPNFIPPFPDTVAYVDSVYSVMLYAEDPEDDTLSFFLLQKPPFLVMLTPDIIIQTAIVQGVPSINDTGYHEIVASVSDGHGGYDTLSWTLHVIVADPTPVEFTTFSAVAIEGKVHLSWTTATETNNYGFQVERQKLGGVYETIGYVPGRGTTATISHYNFTDDWVTTGTYLYRLKQIDYDGTYEYSDTIEITVGAPLEFSLSQNYPNPFNPVTTIRYEIPHASEVQLTVYNLLGQEVEVLINEYQTPGVYEASFDASTLPSGTYFYRLQAGDYTKTNKMVLLK
ncbi:MAG: YCF48-related protein [Candidatus Veblenbacteria bacterium]|nr:YCF48-related protein [Candidatus Veblenbacteria bacterium]